VQELRRPIPTSSEQARNSDLLDAGRMAAGVQPHRLGERSMRVKVHNGTVSDGGSALCASCRHATIIRGRTLDEEIVQCHSGPMTSIQVRFKVTSCSAYDDERLPTYMQLMEDAWILQPGSKRRPAGFIRSRDLRYEELQGVMKELRERVDE
jgi:hypothetical protein